MGGIEEEKTQEKREGALLLVVGDPEPDVVPLLGGLGLARALLDGACYAHALEFDQRDDWCGSMRSLSTTHAVPGAGSVRSCEFDQ